MSFTYFFPSIVNTLGFPRVETLLLTAPPYFLAFLFSILNSWHSGRSGEHCFQLILPWVSATIARPKAKRAVTLALATAVSNATNIATAYLYPAWSAP
jgi:hypothetical protein